MAPVAPFDLRNPEADAPLILSVPHAGRTYPPGIAAELGIPLGRARGLEDRYVDLLLDEPRCAACAALVAHVPRLLVDLNRDENDFGRGARVSERARAGLGVVPTQVTGRSLWRQPLRPATIAERVRRLHRPYHDALAALLARGRQRHGRVILLDLHSMPPIAHGGAELVVGDRHGTTAAAELTAAALAAARTHGLRVSANQPYAGGHIIARHARPSNGVHALQIEVSRALYLDTRFDQPGAGLPATRRLLGAIVEALREVLQSTTAIAAE